jgi:hypothetical protein
MDGRGNLRRDAPWGWKATTWQAWAFLLLAGLMLSNAAWFYSYRVAAVEASAPGHQIVSSRAPAYQEPYDWHAVEAAAASELPRFEALAPDERCIQGIRFAVIDGTLQNVGTC